MRAHPFHEMRDPASDHPASVSDVYYFHAEHLHDLHGVPRDRLAKMTIAQLRDTHREAHS